MKHVLDGYSPVSYTPTFYDKKINIARQNYTHPLADEFYVCHIIKKELSAFITLPNFFTLSTFVVFFCFILRYNTKKNQNEYLPPLVHQNLRGLHHQYIFHPLAYCDSLILVQPNCFVLLNWFSISKK